MVDTVRVVEISDGTFYEYVHMPCVFQGFFDSLKLIARRRNGQVAFAACCQKIAGQYFTDCSECSRFG